jgi:YD repeat-containing protein
VSSLVWGVLAGPLAELDPSGAVKEQFVYGSSDVVPDYILRDGHAYRVVSDERGSPRLVIDTTSGDTVEELDYDTWGRITRDTNPGFQPFGYAGNLHGSLTGLDHMGARDYEPRRALHRACLAGV